MHESQFCRLNINLKTLKKLKTIEVLYFVQQKSDKLEQAVLTSISVVEVITLTISEEMRAHFEQIKA